MSYPPPHEKQAPYGQQPLNPPQMAYQPSQSNQDVSYNNAPPQGHQHQQMSNKWTFGFWDCFSPAKLCKYHTAQNPTSPSPLTKPSPRQASSPAAAPASSSAKPNTA